MVAGKIGDSGASKLYPKINVGEKIPTKVEQSKTPQDTYTDKVTISAEQKQSKSNYIINPDVITYLKSIDDKDEQYKIDMDGDGKYSYDEVNNRTNPAQLAKVLDVLIEENDANIVDLLSNARDVRIAWSLINMKSENALKLLDKSGSRPGILKKMLEDGKPEGKIYLLKLYSMRGDELIKPIKDDNTVKLPECFRLANKSEIFKYYFNLAEDLRHTGETFNFPTALDCYRELLAASDVWKVGDKKQLLKCIGQCELGIKGQADKGIEDLRIALQIDPKYPAANYILGAYQYYNGKYDEAIKYFITAYENDIKQEDKTDDNKYLLSSVIMAGKTNDYKALKPINDEHEILVGKLSEQLKSVDKVPLKDLQGLQALKDTIKNDLLTKINKYNEKIGGLLTEEAASKLSIGTESLQGKIGELEEKMINKSIKDGTILAQLNPKDKEQINDYIQGKRFIDLPDSHDKYKYAATATYLCIQIEKKEPKETVDILNKLHYGVPAASQFVEHVYNFWEKVTDVMKLRNPETYKIIEKDPNFNQEEPLLFRSQKQ